WFVWMSNTRAELEDHLPFLRVVENGAKTVLIHGLGIGAVLAGVLSFDHVDHVDVVERDQRIIRLVAPAFLEDTRVNFVEGDAFKVRWANGITWDAIWHDIWPNINSQNVPAMWKLHQRFRDRAEWQGFWSLPQCVAQWIVTAQLFDAVKAQDAENKVNPVDR